MIVWIVVAVALVAPSSIRNSALHGRFVFMLTTNREVFWRDWIGIDRRGARPPA